MINEKFIKYMKNEINNIDCETSLKQSIEYSLISNGKIIRPLIFLFLLEHKNIDVEKYFPLAMAIECIHSASLIHDDLPCMDDDDLRRGRATNHKVFGETTAVLAGDALFVYAFEQAAKCGNSECIYELALAAGPNNGMMTGQAIDILNEGNTNLDLETLNKIHLQKTAKLLAAPFVMAAIILGEDKEKYRNVGEKLGLVFQIQDDYLDRYATSEELGKPANSDDKNLKRTYTYFYEQTELETIIKNYFKEIYDANEKLSFGENILNLIKKVEERRH